MATDTDDNVDLDTAVATAEADANIPEQAADYGDEISPEQEKAAATNSRLAPEKEPAKAAQNQKTAVEPAADSEEEEEEDKDPVPMIPKSRFDQRTLQLRTAREENAKLLAELEKLRNSAQPASTSQPTETAAPASPTASVAQQLQAAEDAYLAARKDNDAEAELKAMRAIRELEIQRVNEIANSSQNTTMSRLQEEREYAEALSLAESAFPVLNPDSDDYDDKTVERVSELLEAFVARGHSRAVALAKSVEFAFPSTETDEQPTAPAKSGKSNKRSTNVSKNVDAAKRTAPDISTVGVDSDKAGLSQELDMTALTEEEFDALPDSVKAKYRGDTF